MFSFSEMFPSIPATFSADFSGPGMFLLAWGPHEYVFFLLAVLAVVGFYMILIVLVGMARGRYGVAAPATTGHPDFERRLRVQVNTGEQLAPFFATLAIFAFVMGPGLAAIACVTWLIGRVLYAVGYSRAPRLRYPGFALSMFTLCAMIIWAFIVLAWSLLDHPSSNAVPYCTHAGECGIEHWSSL